VTDPVRVRRARIARLCNLAQRIGYLFFAIAVVVFFIGFFGTFTSTLVNIIIIAMVIGSFLLAPAIVFGYAVKAAEREDLENGR